MTNSSTLPEAAPLDLPATLIKCEPADWQVTELSSLALSGEGEHAWFYVEKTGLNTLDVARELARESGVALHQVGFAGRKDKHGITRQWFSVPTPRSDWPLNLDGARVLTCGRHHRKLRLGQHDGNLFRIRLREPGCGAAAALHGLRTGFPNAFGPQRVSSDNLAQAREWVLHRRSRRPIPKGRRAWFLSVLRSDLFNRVLNARLAHGSAARALEGDYLVAGFPSAPLWGRGRSRTRGLAQNIEQAALMDQAALCEALEFSGVQQGRRVMWVVPARYAVETEPGGVLLLTCTLPPGSFATAMLGSVLAVTDARGGAYE